MASRLKYARYLPEPGLVSVVVVISGPAEIGEVLAVPAVCIKNVVPG